MTKARRRVPHESGMVTRRCEQRESLLRPDPMINQILGYLLGYCQQKHQFKLHFFKGMSNHYHEGCTDPGFNPAHSKVPRWVGDFNALAARAINVWRQRTGALWSGGGDSYNFVVSDTVEDQQNRFVYGLNNSVAAGLVSSWKKWPGLVLEPGPSGKRTMTFKKPPVFFSDSMPDEVEVTIEVPPGVKDPRAFMKEVYERLNRQAEEVARQLEAEGRSFMGAKAVRRQSPHSRPSTYEPWRGSRPQIATRDRRRRLDKIRENREFLHEYERCRDAFRAGDREVAFPRGTYKLVAYYGACHQGPDPPH